MKSVKIKFFNKITKHIHITQPTEKKRNRIYIKCTTRIELLHKNFVKKKKKIFTTFHNILSAITYTKF